MLQKLTPRSPHRPVRIAYAWVFAVLLGTVTATSQTSRSATSLGYGGSNPDSQPAASAPVGYGGSAVSDDGDRSSALLLAGGDQGARTSLRIDQSRGPASLTMEAWVWPDSTDPGRAAVVSTDNGSYDWSIVRQREQWVLFTGSNGVRTGFDVIPHRWQHVAAVFDGESATFYLNGQPSKAFPASFEANTAELWIGQSPAYRQGFDGRIDEVRIWNRPLTAREIIANSSRTLSGSERGLMGYWTFDDIRGDTVRDRTRGGHHATLVDGASITTTSPASSVPAPSEGRPTTRYLELDGSTGSVGTDLRLNQTGPRAACTLEAWAWPNEAGHGRHHVISTDNRGYDWSILTQHEDWVVFTGKYANRTGFKVIPNQWQHVAAVFDGDQVVFYLNGQPSDPMPIDFDASTDTVHIGRNPAFNEFFAGRIDEVRVWSRARTAEEIRSVMNRELSGSEPGLIGYWQLNEIENGSTADASSRRHDGTVHGTARILPEAVGQVPRTLQRGRGTTSRP